MRDIILIHILQNHFPKGTVELDNNSLTILKIDTFSNAQLTFLKNNFSVFKITSLHIDHSNFWQIDPENLTLIATMIRMSSIKHLFLNDNGLIHCTRAQWQALLPLFTAETLESVDLCKNDLEHIPDDDWHQTLFQLFLNLAQLKKINLILTPDPVLVQTKNRYWQQLLASHHPAMQTNLDTPTLQEGTHFIVTVYRFCNEASEQDLNLQSSQLTMMQLRLLASHCHQLNKKIKTLNISDNHALEDGTALDELLASQDALVHLDLSNNRFANVTYWQLTKFLAHNTSLETLKLHTIKAVSPIVAPYFLASLCAHPKLTQLSLDKLAMPPIFQTDVDVLLAFKNAPNDAQNSEAYDALKQRLHQWTAQLPEINTFEIDLNEASFTNLARTVPQDTRTHSHVLSNDISPENTYYILDFVKYYTPSDRTKLQAIINLSASIHLICLLDALRWHKLDIIAVLLTQLEQLHSIVVNDLIELNLNVSINTNADTLLHLAVPVVGDSTCKRLVLAGAHIFASNSLGETPLSIARSVNDTLAETLLDSTFSLSLQIKNLDLMQKVLQENYRPILSEKTLLESLIDGEAVCLDAVEIYQCLLHYQLITFRGLINQIMHHTYPDRLYDLVDIMHYYNKTRSGREILEFSDIINEQDLSLRLADTLPKAEVRSAYFTVNEKGTSPRVYALEKNLIILANVFSDFEIAIVKGVGTDPQSKINTMKQYLHLSQPLNNTVLPILFEWINDLYTDDHRKNIFLSIATLYIFYIVAAVSSIRNVVAFLLYVIKSYPFSLMVPQKELSEIDGVILCLLNQLPDLESNTQIERFYLEIYTKVRHRLENNMLSALCRLGLRHTRLSANYLFLQFILQQHKAKIKQSMLETTYDYGLLLLGLSQYCFLRYCMAVFFHSMVQGAWTWKGYCLYFLVLPQMILNLVADYKDIKNLVQLHQPPLIAEDHNQPVFVTPQLQLNHVADMKFFRTKTQELRTTEAHAITAHTVS